MVKVKGKGYGIEVKKGRIEVWGEENLVYSTLVQLLRIKEGFIPQVRVEDEMNFSFRGFHLDIARGAVPTVDYFKEIIRWLFLLKYTHLAIYLEDLFAWKRHPLIGWGRGRMEREELKEIIEYGKRMGIEVFPSLELCGHMEHILTLKPYRKFSEWWNPQEGCLDADNPEARNFTLELLEEVLDFFPSSFIHVGGDETWALGRGKSLTRYGVFKGPQIYKEHHQQILKKVRERGKIPLLWSDMITGCFLREEGKRWREIMKDEVWGESLLVNWDYSPEGKEYFEERIETLSQGNFKQIVAPGFHNWACFYPHFGKAIRNLKNFLEAAKKKVEGFLVTSWGDDGGECLFTFLYPLLVATMELAEGKGEWEEGWKTLSREGEILEIRKKFGEGQFADLHKYILWESPCFLKYNWKVNKREWEKLWQEASSLSLPEELSFLKEMLEVCLKKLEGKVNPSHYLNLARRYKELWLKERKEEGLERIYARFWYLAGQIEGGFESRERKGELRIVPTFDWIVEPDRG